MNEQLLDRVKFDRGFIAALDQSGGSTPKALELYGVPEDAYSGDDEMFAVMHEMRSRIITSPSFNGDRVLGAILFENTMDRQIGGRDSAEYLWTVKRVVPFVKVDKGLAGKVDGVQVMKPIPDLDALLARAIHKGVFGTKMRSVIRLANDAGVKSVVDQQFDIARQIMAAGLVPIIEPEIDIHSPQKAEAEALLRVAILEQLGQLDLRPIRHAQADAARARRLLCGAGGAPERPPGRRPLRRLQPRRGQRPSCSQPRRDRELLPGPYRGSLGPAERRGLRCGAERLDRWHLRGIGHLNEFHDVATSVMAIPP